MNFTSLEGAALLGQTCVASGSHNTDFAGSRLHPYLLLV